MKTIKARIFTIRPGKRLLPVLAMLSMSMMGKAWAGEQLQLRLELRPDMNTTAISASRASVGQFALTPSQAEHAGGEQLRVIARDSRGRVVHEVTVPNRSYRMLETFEPRSGAIDQVQTVRPTQAFVDINLPFDARVASIEVLEQGVLERANPRSAQGFKLPRPQLQKLVSDTAQLNRMTPPPSLAATPKLTTILNNGSTASKMDFVFIGEGYTAAEMGKWQNDAQQIIDAFKADPLLAANLSKINIHRIDIASNQSGVDEIDKGIYRDTAMDGQFACYNTARLLCVDANKATAIAAQVLPADGYEQIVVIANSTRYGGSGGAVAAVSMDPSSKEVALHEIGHSAFGLADEYDYGSCNTSVEPTAKNVSRVGTRSNSKWGDLIGANTPVPTQVGTVSNGTVGAFLGGNYCTSGMYRPTENSRMRTLGYPWHAVNTRLANQVFAKYTGGTGGGGTGTEQTQTGSLAVGASVTVPNASPAYVQAGSGVFSVKLSGPTGTDFDLFLFKWNEATSKWDQVAKSEGSTSTEAISYNGAAGYYYASVKSYAGSGTYTVKYTFPPK